MQLIPKLQTGYAFTSLKSENHAIVSADSPNKFIGFAFHDGRKYGRFRIGNKHYFQLCYPNPSECKQYAFTEHDVQSTGTVGWFGRISCTREMLFDTPLWHHVRGLSQTASGYGKKLTTPYCMFFEGKLHRVYCCIFSNIGTCYIVSKNRKIIVDC